MFLTELDPYYLCEGKTAKIVKQGGKMQGIEQCVEHKHGEFLVKKTCFLLKR